MADLFDELGIKESGAQHATAPKAAGDLLSELEQPSAPIQAQQPVQPREQQGVFSTIADLFTGESRTTPQIEGLREIGEAPELNQFTFDSIRSAAALLATGDTEKAMGVVKTQVPDADFKQDAKGNFIAVLPSGEYAMNKPGLTGADIARGIFQFGAFTPSAKAAMLPTGVARRLGVAGAGAAATETGLQAGVQTAGGGDISAEDIALAGALGVGGQTLGEGVSAAARGLAGRISPQAQQTLQAGEREGVGVLTTDVLPPNNIVGGLARQLGERIPILGTGGTRSIQARARENAVKEFVDAMPPVDHDAIINSLKAQTSKVKRAAGNRVGRVTDEMDVISSVPMANTTNAIDDAIDQLERVKIGRDESTIENLKSIGEGAQQPHLFSELRRGRTAVRELIDSTDAMGRSQMPSFSKKMLESVRSAMTRDLDNFVLDNAGASALSRYKDADRIYAGEARKLTKSRIKNVLDKGDLTPETVEAMLLSRKPSEVRLLHKSLSAEGKKAARSALVARAAKKATREDDFSVNVFANELGKLKESTSVFFKGDDAKRLNGLRKLLNATRRAQDAAVVTPTGQGLFGLTAIGAGSQVGALPALGAAATGGAAARIYESVPMRNFLLRLDNTPINSTGFDRLVRTSLPKINALLQSVEGQN